ncbi:hypothetical protein PNOK_0217200 [Pyrrhoderma noxium]|uniref:Mediator of RNA polymerase II transcription subunit 9 n=1 Tax=Pyrrhoderma noxium TaxID=2282107 RepID=A0A286URW8_9AGAM|nr:hypothetical protein PNOK_0217200 [Pyrrhoderma noxium]
MASSSFPDPVFESLLDKLAHTLEVAQKLDMEQNIETRQQLFQATTDFKNSLAKAKEIANTLPGGEMLVSEQNDVIAMLETLRDMKRSQLSQFSSQSLSVSNTGTGISADEQMKIEIDSTASSPHD